MIFIAPYTSIEITSTAELQKVGDLLTSQGYMVSVDNYLSIAKKRLALDQPSIHYAITYSDKTFKVFAHKGTRTVTHLKASDL